MHQLVDLIAILLSLVLVVVACRRTMRTPRISRAPVDPRPAPHPRTNGLLTYQVSLADLPPASTTASSSPARDAHGYRRPAARSQVRSATGRRTAPAAREAAERLRTRYQRRLPWYRRKLVVAPLAVLALLGTVLSAGAWYAASQLASLDDISTPPPVVSGEFLDGDDSANTVIDTSAAREHVEQQEELVETPDATPAPPGSLTVLVMGVDAREGQPIDIEVRADSIAAVHINPEAGTCRMLSVPRDTRVELPGYGYSKMNHALAIGGVPYQQLVVEGFLGIEFDHYGLIDMAGLARMVDAVGGITVENPDYPFDIHDFHFEVGTLELSGDEVAAFAQYRGGPDGDYGRQKRHQQVIRSLLKKGAGLDIITALPEVLTAVRGHIRTDSNARSLMSLAQTYRSTCTADSLETATMQGTVALAWDDLSGQELTFVHLEDTEVEEKVAWLFGLDESRTSPDAARSPQVGTVDSWVQAAGGRESVSHRAGGNATLSARRPVRFARLTGHSIPRPRTRNRHVPAGGRRGGGLRAPTRLVAARETTRGT